MESPISISEFATETRFDMHRRSLTVMKTKPVRTALLCAVAFSLLAAPSSHATALSAFHTPGWAVQCYVVGEESPPTLTCSRPSNGSFVAMRATSLVETGSDQSGRGYHDPFAARRLLSYGRYWEFGSFFGCVSRSTELKCWNQAGHGWRIGRDGRRHLF